MSRLEQPSKVEAGMMLMPSPSCTDISFGQWRNTPLPSSGFPANETDASFGESPKALFPMEITVAGMLTEVKAAPAKADSPIEAALAGKTNCSTDDPTSI